MKPPIKGRKAGAVVPKNGEARTTVAVGSGLKVKNESKQRKHTKAIAEGKSLDSRSQVIAKAKAGAKIGLATYNSTPEKVQALKALRDAMPGNSGATQEKRILEALSRGSLSTFEASRYLDAFDPRARVMALRNKGHCITTHWVLQRTECGRPHRIGVYVLQRDAALIPAGQRAPESSLGAGLVTGQKERA